MFAIPGSPPLQLAVAPRLASCNAAGDQDQGAGGVLACPAYPPAGQVCPVRQSACLRRPLRRKAGVG